MKLFACAAMVCLSLSLQCASMAQQNVVFPDESGLAHPASSQIGDGTISPSARGGDRNKLGLPITPLGPNVRAGDVSRSDLNHGHKPGTKTRGSKGALIQTLPQVNPALPAAPIGPHVRAGDISRSDLHPRKMRPHSGYNHAVTNPGLPAAPIGPHMRAGDIDRSDLHPHRFDRNKKFWNQGRSATTTTRSTNAAPPYQPPTATYKTDKNSSERF